MRRLALIAALILCCAATPAMAAKPTPGSSCAGQNTGAFTTSGGQETGGIVYFLVCDGSNWQPIGMTNHAANNVGFGYGVLYASGSYYDTAVGDRALANNTTGQGNTVVGGAALYSNSTNSYNTAVGYEALFGAQAGYNTAIGYNALFSDSTGGQNTAIGDAVGGTLATGSHNILIGGGVPAADVPTGSTSNFLNIGNAIYGTGILGGSPTYIGIGTTAPAAPLHVNGEAIVGMKALACAAGTAGAIRYNSAVPGIEFCNGTAWIRNSCRPRPQGAAFSS